MSTFTRLTRSLRHGIADMRYAQKRLFAHRTGIDVIDYAHVPGVVGTAAELEALYALGTRIPPR
ncbi:MAG TPA: hypothetical protein VFN55_02035 [Solirubrobacteraceae bacterium]|nr:hypothetical protein [Solirubrobacteraceae bacterium]